MASLVTKEVEALRAVTDGQNLNSEQVGYLTRLANTEFGREVFFGGPSTEPKFVEEARSNPAPAPQQAPQPQQSVAQQEAATAPLPPAALAAMPVGAIRVPSFFSPRSAPVSFDDDIDINNLPENISSEQMRQALNQKANDPNFELTESQNVTRMRLNKKAGDEIDRAFIAANQAIPGLASLIGGAAKEWFLTITGQPVGAAIADYVVTRMRAQDMRKQGPGSEGAAAELETQAQNQIAEYGDARLREAATLGESVRKTYINTRSLWNWARQFNDSMMSEVRKRDMLRDNLTASGVLRNPEQELLSPDQRRSMQMENEVILQREWEARKAGEIEDPALDAASEDEEFRRQHAAYVQNKALERANLGIVRFNRGGQEVEERANIRFADPVRFPSPFTDRLITPMENTATLGSIAMDPFNIAGGVLGATTKWRLIHRTASVLGKPLTGIERGAAGIRAAMEARREARIIRLAERTGVRVDQARVAYDRSTRGLLNVATGGSGAGFGLGYLMSKDENFSQMGDALMVGGAILPALRGAGFVIRNTPKVAGVGGIVLQEAKAGPMGDISRIARNSTNHAEVIRAARPASAQELLQSGVVPPQYARHMRTYTDRAGNLNMAGGAARGADSTLKRVAQNPSNPENVRRFARLADQAGATGLVRALDDVASGTVAAGIGVAPFVAIAPEPEQAGAMIGGAVAFGAAGGLVGGRAMRSSEAFDIDVARTMVDLNAQGADVGTLFSLPRQSLEKIVNVQAMAANKGVDLVLLRDEDYRATLPDVSQGTHMQRAGNVKHTVQEGDTLDSLARRYYGTGEAWSRIVAANEGKIAENGGLPAGIELDMPGDNRWRMFVNMGHYSLEGGTVRVAKQPDGTTRVSVIKDDGTSAYDFQTPNPQSLRVKDGQKVSAYEPLTNKIDRSLTAMHEFGHEVMRSDMFDGDHRIELRAIVQQIYGADGVQARKRDYAARMVDREIESGVSEGVEFEFANEQERRDVRDGRVTIAQLRRQRGQQVKSRQELIDEKVAELDQDSVDRTGSPDAWVQDEIVNETLASEVNALELSRIRRGDNPEFLIARAGEAVTTMTGRLLELFGVRLNRSTGKPLDTPSTIFRENPLMKDPVLRKRLLEYVRNYDRYLVGLEDAGSANAKGARMAKSDRAEDFGNSPLVTLHPDPKTGRLENAFLFRGEDGKFYFKEQGDIDAAYKLQREQIRNMVRAQGGRKVPLGSGVFGVRTDDAGRTFVGGAKLPKEFDSMIHIPQHLRQFARALEEGATSGRSWIIQNHFVGSSDSGSYKLSRVRASGRTIPREAVFINWKVTSADNILGVFLDLDAFRAATMKAINNNELAIFNNDIGVVQQKLLQLMDNHRNGRSGAAGLDASPDVAIEMKNTLNGLIGTGTAVQRSTDAFTSLNPRGSIRTYRLDRIDSIKPTGRTGLHADYDKINQNRMPNTERRGQAMADTDPIAGNPAQAAPDMLDGVARQLDSVGNKLALVKDRDTLPYPQNPVAGSVVLPPRYGLVNTRLAGMPRTFRDVTSLVNTLVGRVIGVIQNESEFARNSGTFYEDMARSGLDLAQIVDPSVVKDLRTWFDRADEMVRYLALGSPRTNVDVNSTKSAGAASSVTGGYIAGYKMGFGDLQRATLQAQKDYQAGRHFDLDIPGIQDKVRSFYINGLAELIDIAKSKGRDDIAEMLTLRAAKSLKIAGSDVEVITPELYREAQRLLDGKATVDMWDMAAKRIALPGFILMKHNRTQAIQPFEWTQKQNAVRDKIGGDKWSRVAKELGVSSPAQLRYQQARSLGIEGNFDWDAASWNARLASGASFDGAGFTYYTKGTEAGLNPGGGGPLYDAQQAIDGMVADVLNQSTVQIRQPDGSVREVSVPEFFGRDKLKARHTQEILWALEKRDNPIEKNNDLSLFGNSFGPLKQELAAIAGQGGQSSTRGQQVLGAMDRAYTALAAQEFPFEVDTSGTSAEARFIQQKVETMRSGGSPDPMTQLTAHVADGLADNLNSIFAKHGEQITADAVRTVRASYTMDDGQLTFSSAIALTMRGDPARVAVVKDIVSATLDQERGQTLRAPSVRELHKGENLSATAAFNTRGLNDAQIEAFFRDLASINDSQGNRIFTGYMPGDEKIFVGGHFYKGNFAESIDAASSAVESVMQKHGVSGFELRDMMADTFVRGQDIEDSRLTRDISDYISSRIATADATSPMSVAQRADIAKTLRERGDMSKRMTEQKAILENALKEFSKDEPPSISEAMEAIGAGMTISKNKATNAALRDKLRGKKNDMKGIPPQERQLVAAALKDIREKAQGVVVQERAAFSEWKKQMRAANKELKTRYDGQRVSDEFDAAVLLGYVEGKE